MSFANRAKRRTTTPEIRSTKRNRKAQLEAAQRLVSLRRKYQETETIKKHLCSLCLHLDSFTLGLSRLADSAQLLDLRYVRLLRANVTAALVTAKEAALRLERLPNATIL